MKPEFHQTRKYLFAGWLLAAVLLFAPAAIAGATSLAQTAEQGKAIFDQKCKACHTIGGGVLVGPDLQGVTQRADLTWIKEFITAPDKKFAAGDPAATQLLAQFNNVPMPNLGLSAAEVDSLVAYLQNPAGAGQAAPGTGTTQAPGAAAQAPGVAAQGQAIFTGKVALLNGGVNCIACHSVSGVAALGGGSLGPDLTHVAQRYGGQAGLAGVLGTLPFPTMQGIFATRGLGPQEQADLLAFLLQADQNPAQPPVLPGNLNPWIAIPGALGSLALFIVLAVYWPRQRRSISERLRSKA